MRDISPAGEFQQISSRFEMDQRRVRHCSAHWHKTGSAGAEPIGLRGICPRANFTTTVGFLVIFVHELMAIMEQTDDRQTADNLYNFE